MRLPPFGNRPRPAASCSPWANRIVDVEQMQLSRETETKDRSVGTSKGMGMGKGMAGEGSTTVINFAHMHAEMISTATLHGEW